MRKTIRSSSTLVILIVVVISLGVFVPPKPMYAHTFSGGESAKFLALVKILEADANLTQTNIASNITLAQEHAKAVAEHFDANTTKELAERNKLVTSDLTKAVSDLQKTVGSKPAPTSDVVKGKVDNFNALLQEAVTVRIEKNQLNNSTVKGQALANIADEALERYREAYGIEEGKSGAGHTTVVNMADYQSAQAIAAKGQEMFNEAKQLVIGNASLSSATTSGAIAKVGDDLIKFKNDIDTKTQYDKVAAFMESTLDPDIEAAFKLK
jgi:hypothetical protein